MTKIYLCHPISTRGEFEDSKRVAERIRALGFEVYAAAENASINDKSNEPTPIDIYDADMSELLSADIVVANVTGGHADGTIMEIGAVAGANEMERLQRELFAMHDINLLINPTPIIGYTTNARMLQPQFYEGVPSASANHLVLGAIARWGEFVGSEDAMIEELERLKGGDV